MSRLAQRVADPASLVAGSIMVIISNMRTHRKYLPYFYYFLISLIPLLFFVLIANPDKMFDVSPLTIGAPLFLFPLLFTSLFFLFTFIFANIRRGILASLFVCAILILRLFGFRSGYQTVILLIIALLVEYLYTKRHR